MKLLIAFLYSSINRLVVSLVIDPYLFIILSADSLRANLIISITLSSFRIENNGAIISRIIFLSPRLAIILSSLSFLSVSLSTLLYSSRYFRLRSLKNISCTVLNRILSTLDVLFTAPNPFKYFSISKKCKKVAIEASEYLSFSLLDLASFSSSLELNVSLLPNTCSLSLTAELYTPAFVTSGL